MKKVCIAITVIVAIAMLAVGIGITTSNRKKADEIYQNCLGMTFKGTEEDDHGFADNYAKGTLAVYAVHYLDEASCTLTFNEDGSVDWSKESDKVVLAFPKNLPEPEDYHYEDSGHYDSFQILIDLKGNVSLLLGETDKFDAAADSNNVLWRIWDFKGVDVH